MSRSRTTADVLDSILRRAGEPTNGNSDREADALEYLDKVHKIVLKGGNVFGLDIDDTWPWARARLPLILELQPPFTSGSLTLTQGSSAGTLSAPPAYSLEGWHFQVRSNPYTVSGDREIYRITQHTASAAAFQFDSAYVGGTGSGVNFNCFKIDYEIAPDYIYVDSRTDKIDFFETTAVQLTATLTHGTYTPAAYAAQWVTQLNAAGASTYTGNYNADTRKLTFTSDLTGGGNQFGFLGATGTNQGRSALPPSGFDDLDTSSAASQVATYLLGGVARLVEPFRVFRTWDSTIDCVDGTKMAQEYPLTDTRMGLPTKFVRLHEDQDGRIWVRFNKYAQYLTKIEIEYVPVPRDLQDNAASRPLLPREYADVLEYGAASFVLLDKMDGKAASYEGLAAKQLEAMQRNNRSELYKAGRNFGEVVAREDLRYNRRQRLRYGYTADDDN
jgi:hypothetical protein